MIELSNDTATVAAQIPIVDIAMSQRYELHFFERQSSQFSVGKMRQMRRDESFSIAVRLIVRVALL